MKDANCVLKCTASYFCPIDFKANSVYKFKRENSNAVAVSLCHYQCVSKKREFYRCYHLNKLRKKIFLPLQNRHFEDGLANFNNSIPVVPSLILGLHYFLSVVDVFDLCPNRD